MQFGRSLILTVIFMASCTTANAQADSADIYSRRVLPLLRTPTGASCKECHFSGVELSAFFNESEADTFAALKRPVGST